MDDRTAQLLVEVAYVLGIGLLVGLEREHSEVALDEDAAARAKANEREFTLGVRTFALLALFGWTSAFLGEVWWTWFPPAALIVVGGLMCVEYIRSPGPGLTTEVAAVVTFSLGLIVHYDRLLAVALALATTLLLIAKPWVREVVPKLRRIELTATLQLLILLAIVLPLLPAEARDPWGALPPRRIGWFVVLVGGISYVGYVLHRILGDRAGTGLAGAVGGIVSSTAATASMAQGARRDPERTAAAQLGAFLANAVMFARVLVITAVISRSVALALLPGVGAMGLLTLACAGWKWLALRGRPTGEAGPPRKLQNPFALVPALKWGLVLCGVLLLAAFCERELGQRGVLAAAAASGIADVDAITLALTKHVSDGGLAPGAAALAITVAILVNTLVKSGIALFAGGRRFGVHVAAGLLGAAAVGVAVAALG